jgi:hypothetical protein
MTRLADWLRSRVGRRGAALLVFAFVDVVIGWSLLDGQGRAQAAALPTYRAFREVAPLTFWGGAWLAAAVVCAVWAFRRDDWPGFTVAIGIKLVWAAGFLTSWLAWDAPRGWLGAATWGVIAALVYLISGWPDIEDREQ